MNDLEARDDETTDSAPPRHPYGTRTKARELALKFLYGADIAGRGGIEGFDAFAIHQDARGTVVAFARDLVAGVLARKAEIDLVLRGLASNWTLERMAVVDRNVLRLGCYEILDTPETPVRVAINEAVDLAKKFGSESSGAFVNGILDRVKRPAEATDSRKREG